MLIHILQLFAGAAFIILMVLFVYIGQHIQEEKHQGKGLPMMWEPGGLWSRCFKKEEIHLTSRILNTEMGITHEK